MPSDGLHSLGAGFERESGSLAMGEGMTEA